jgi:hypothetical protein
MAKELSREFAHPKAKVWDALPGALESVKMKIDFTDHGAGRVDASTGVSLSSWGEKVSVQVGEAGPNATTVTVTTGLKVGLVGWGKLKKNINRVFESLDRTLGN